MADDSSGLAKLARDLGEIPANSTRNLRTALEVNLRHLKDDWSQGAEATGLHDYAASIDYDIEVSGVSFKGEVGPNMGKRQGRFGFVEEGGDKVQSAPQHAGRDALEANEPDLDRGIGIALDHAFKAAGL